MFKKIKYYLIGIAVLFLISTIVIVNIQSQIIKKRNAEIVRIGNNNYQLMADNRNITNLNLVEKEVNGRLKIERDSLAASLKIKPKSIEKIISIDNSTHDTVKVPVSANIIGPDKWRIADKGDCFKWQGNAFKQGDSLKIQRTLFEYSNRTIQVFYKTAPHFWFIRTGKWQYLQKIESECGQTTLQSFTFLKK